jgi:hypothetical protein
MSNEISKKVYTFSDIPKKREYLLKRLKKIYPTTNEKSLRKTLNSIKIKFRDQEERGASNHIKKIVYLPLNDFKKYNLLSRDDVLKYLCSPECTITHETMHIFQNLSKSFPDIQYAEKDEDGDLKIDYDKYWNDPGEKQSRLEQVNELIDWGFTRSEIINFLYNRSHNDQELWNRIIDHAMNLRKQQIGG